MLCKNFSHTETQAETTDFKGESLDVQRCNKRLRAFWPQAAGTILSNSPPNLTRRKAVRSRKYGL